MTTTAVPAPRILIGYNPDRPWYAQWHNVRQHLETVEADCQPGAYRGNDPVKRDFENFFTQCFHLGDWLWEDKTTGLTHQQVRTFIDKEAALRICAGVANTSKHRTRSQPNAITARIASVGFDGEGTHVTIDWSEGLHGGTENALDSPAVRGCVGWLSQGEWSAISHIGSGPKVFISWSGEQSRQGRSRLVRVAATSSTRSESVYV